MAEPFILFENTKTGESFAFAAPVARICTSLLHEVPDCLERADKWRKRGYFVAGYVAYEAGWAFTKRAPRALPSYPLIDLYIFRDRREWRDSGAPADTFFYGFDENLTAAEHAADLREIFARQRAGDCYQINHTYKLRFRSSAGAWDTYRTLRREQSVEYAAFLNLPDLRILSFSPELFLRRTGKRLESKPMKGTAPRHRDRETDRHSREFLANDLKNRAENVMIVDLLRNDMGRIASPGSVKTPLLFKIEDFETVYQMVSTIECELTEETGLRAIFASLFPCGSITGAPKLSSMGIIDRLEREPRGVYTGAIGFIEPSGDFCFSVAIRTLVQEEQDGAYALGIGGGVLLESDPVDEWNEARLKSRFVSRANRALRLIETMRFTGQEIADLPAHLQRLEASSAYFGFEFNRERTALALLGSGSDSRGEKRVRLCLHGDGNVEVSTEDLSPITAAPMVGIGTARVRSSDVFLGHKTDRRALYELEYNKGLASGLYDVLFFNEREELTEASRHNVFVKLSGQWFTPPLGAGLLPGIERAKRIATLPAREKILTVEDLRGSEAILLTNSVRGAVFVRLREM